MSYSWSDFTDDLYGAIVPGAVKNTKKIDDQVEEWAKDNADNNSAAAALDNAYDTQNNTMDTITAPFEKLGSYFVDGWKTIKKYWYVPVIIGGVIVGYKIIGRANINKALSALAAKTS